MLNHIDMDSTVEAVKLFLSAHIGGDYQSQIISLLSAAGIFVTAVAAYYVCKWILYLYNRPRQQV